MSKEDPDPVRREQAKITRTQIYHMHHMGLVRYVGFAENDKEPEISLLRLLQKNENILTCVLTANERLITMLNGITVPNCLCLNLWGNRGVALRSESRQRFAKLLGGETETKKVSEQEKKEVFVENVNFQ